MMKRRDALQLGGSVLLSTVAAPVPSFAGPVLAAEIPSLSHPPSGSGLPTIVFTQVPAYGSADLLRGRVENVDPGKVHVCPYIRVEGIWYTKPTYATPFVDVNSDGTWEANIATGGYNDTRALEIVAFLTDNSYVPPRSPTEDPAQGLGCHLPGALFVKGWARAVADRTAMRPTIAFSALEWSVKDVVWGPDDNFFHSDNVAVDRQGQLHLKIAPRAGIWYSSEVVAKKSFGYGRYVYYLSSQVDQLNENVVLGLFTWDTNGCDSYFGEVDIEFSRWGDKSSQTNAQYVVQPFAPPGNLHRFNLLLPEGDSTHVIDWRKDMIQFTSLQGHNIDPASGKALHQWAYHGPAVPEPGTGNARINLWLFHRQPPSDGKEVEVVVNRFDVIA